MRIYALAKELNLNSKALLEMCSKAGIDGKDSQLASLTSEEESKLREFIASGARSAPSRPTPAPMTPPPVLPVAKKPIPVIPAAPAAPSTPAEPAPQAPAPAAPEVVAPAPVQPATNLPPAAMRREDYVPPGGVSNKMVHLTDKPDGGKKRPGGDGPRPARTAPAIKLAPMPTSSQSGPPPKPAEPAAQKPDIKLPMDVLKASKSGGKPLSRHIREHDEKRKADADDAKSGKTAAGRTSGRSAAPAAPLAPGMPGRDRVRRGGRGALADDEAAAAAAAAAANLRKRRSSSRRRGDDDDGRSRGRRIHRRGTNTAAPRKGNVVCQLPCTVRTFSEAAGVPAAKVLLKLMQLNAGKPNLNAPLEDELAEMLAVELGVSIEFKKPQNLEDQLLATSQEDEDPELLEPRPPIVTFLGHVDHGKTSLLDRIIGIDVAGGESGGITQHIRAYRIERDGQTIAFVDTPGHEAFTQMRARGAQVTDIAVLVVAADDGVMPQTEEAISHAKAAGVPIVVALNKIDLPGVNTQRIYEQLAANELLPSEWGGETEVVKCSATKGTGIEQLLETLLLTAELHDYRSNPNRAAEGTCLEAELHEGRGVVAKFIVQNGTLKVGDVVVCGTSYGRVKAMYDTLKPRISYESVGPSTPVNMTGLNEAPAAGQHFHVLADIASARAIADKRSQQSRAVTLSGHTSHVTLETLKDRLGQDEVQNLNIILRADVRGSIEAILKEFSKLSHPEVQLKILQSTVGGISEADVHLADASDAIIIGFNVVPDEKARMLAENLGVQVRRYEIIYQVTQDLKLALEGLLKPEERDVELGRALILRTFTISRVGTVAGCRVLSGTIERNSRLRVIRENRVIGDYALDSLKREKDDARDVREGYECGIKLSGFNDLKEGDILEAYKVEEIARTI
ncbi:MAG: translation initiation factor IF-2 [Pirellulales bacterium]